MEVERETQQKKRERSAIPRVALVGYTNAGKSTIMNAMVETYIGDEEKKVLEKDMLFATLDTSVRNITPKENKTILLSDTDWIRILLPPVLWRQRSPARPLP